MKEHWDFILLPCLEVATSMGSSSIIASDVVVITNLVHHLALIEFEWVFTDGALSGQKEVFLVCVCHYHPLVIEEIRHTSLFQIGQFIQHPIDTIFASVNLYLNI